MISKELFKFTLKHYRWYPSNAPSVSSSIINSRIFHPTHVPFYTIGFYPELGLPVEKLYNEDIEPDEFDMKYGKQQWMANAKYIKFIKECLSRNMYNIILLSDFTMDWSCSSLKNMLLSRAFNRLNRSVTTHFPRAVPEANIKSSQFMFECMKLCNSFVLHYIKYNGVPTGKNYLTNMFLLADKISSTEYNPLVVGMVEKDRIIEARKCFITSSPMPTDLLELWVDSSVEEAGSKLKPLFRKYMKANFERVGIPIRYFPNLRKEIMCDVIPKRETIEEAHAWNSSILKMFYEYGKDEYELDRPEHYKGDSTILSNLSKDIDEVLAAIGD